MQDIDYNLNNYIGQEMSYSNIPKIRVAVRKRPTNKKEMQRNDIDIIEQRGSQTVIVKELKYSIILIKK